MSTITETPKAEKVQATLPADRCDRCGAAAMVRTYFGDSDLLWCSHHFNKHEDAIRALTDEIYDNRI